MNMDLHHSAPRMDTCTATAQEPGTASSAASRDLLGSVAHDLRSPLNAIVLSAAAIRDACSCAAGPERARIESALGIVERSTRHMTRLVDELLEAVIADVSQLPLSYSEVNVGELIHAVFDMLMPEAHSKSVCLQTGAAPLVVTCDRERVFRVLTNLVGNAVKFARAEVRVSVGLHAQVDAVCIRVYDDGLGVPEGQERKLFDPYWRGQRRGRGGVGLGLFIARSIVIAHGGHIWVESSEGQGSVFCFTLPCAALHEQARSE